MNIKNCIFKFSLFMNVHVNIGCMYVGSSTLEECVMYSRARCELTNMGSWKQIQIFERTKHMVN